MVLPLLPTVSDFKAMPVIVNNLFVHLRHACRAQNLNEKQKRRLKKRLFLYYFRFVERPARGLFKPCCLRTLCFLTERRIRLKRA